jgi:hypothetical protein
MPMSPEGPYLVATQNEIALPHAMGYTPPDGATRYGGQANTLMQHQPARMSPPPRLQAPWQQQSVSPDGAMGVDGELHAWGADTSAASRAAYSSDIDPGVINADTFGSNALLILESVPTANSEAFETGFDMSEFVHLDDNRLGPETL